jgi:2'-5' RNA ligase
MSSLVIVALPAEDELVNKISSEKVPHLTLMYLGEATDDNNVTRMAEFVEHALNISEHGPFYLEVDYRGELGPNKADVLFFQGGWEAKWIKSLRGQLLQQADIRTAFESADQFPEWVPHLTLGYPETPANPMPEERKFFSVQFDRIAVWTGNYEGPEFRLKWPDRDMEDLAVAYSDTGKEAVESLLHFGVKGMKWGQRKTPNVVEVPRNNLSPGQIAAIAGLGPAALLNRGVREGFAKNQVDGQAFQKDKKWEKDFKKAKGFGFDDQKFTNDYNDKWKDHDFSKEDWNNPSPAYKKYQDGYFKEMNTAYSQQFAAHYGSSPSGKYEAFHDKTNDTVKLRKKDAAAHSIDDGVLVEFRIKRGDDGLISGLEEVEDMGQAVHTAELGEEFLEHFGVKGMKWGQRKENAPATVKTVGRGLKKVGRGIGKAASALGEHFYETSVYSVAAHERIHNQVGREIDQKIYQLASSPKYRGKSLKANKELETEYHQDVARVTDAAYRRAVKNVIGENAKGTKEARYVDDARGARIEIRNKKTGELHREGDLTSVQQINANKLDEVLGHAAIEAAPDITIPVKLDSNGQISSIGLVEPSAEHSMDLGEAFVIHYGVKGMKWGQRKDRNEPGLLEKRRAMVEAKNRDSRPAVTPRVQDSIGSSKRKKTSLSSKGGEDHPASEDAIKVAEAERKLKKSGVHALSNKELQEVATRLNLENQVAQLHGKRPKSLGKKFVDSLLGDRGEKKKKKKGGDSDSSSLLPKMAGAAAKALL